MDKWQHSQHMTTTYFWHGTKQLQKTVLHAPKTHIYIIGTPNISHFICPGTTGTAGTYIITAFRTMASNTAGYIYGTTGGIITGIIGDTITCITPDICGGTMGIFMAHTARTGFTIAIIIC